MAVKTTLEQLEAVRPTTSQVMDAQCRESAATEKMWRKTELPDLQRREARLPRRHYREQGRVSRYTVGLPGSG